MDDHEVTGLEIVRTWRGDDVEIRAKGGQFAKGGGRVPGNDVAGTGAYAGGGSGGDGSLTSPGALPADVKPSLAGIRTHVRKTITEAIEPKKEHLTHVKGPVGNVSIGMSRSVTGTTVSVTPNRTGASVHISQLKSGSKPAAIAALRAAGYKVPDPHPNSQAAKSEYDRMSGPISFNVAGAFG